MVNEPVRQAVKQEQAPAPTIDLLARTVKRLSFYQKPVDFVPQKQLPRNKTTLLQKENRKEKQKEIDHPIPVFVLLKGCSAHSG